MSRIGHVQMAPCKMDDIHPVQMAQKTKTLGIKENKERIQILIDQ